MHRRVLADAQINLLPLIKVFSGAFFLAGGTAVALHIGHRRSIDFDLFTAEEIHRIRLRNRIQAEGFSIQGVLYEAFDQMHLLVNSVKLTFFSFPYPIPHPVDFEGIITVPALLDLAAMKAFTLVGRAKWKDYVDMYYILKDHYDVQHISSRAREIFGQVFNEKLFREQVCYFDDIDYSEKVEYLGNAPGDEAIKQFLSDAATAAFR